MTSKILAAKCSPEMVSRIVELAFSRGLSVSQLLRRIIEQYLRKQER